MTLQIAKDAKPGDLDGTVKIYTSDKVNPIVTVPVRARGQGRRRCSGGGEGMEVIQFEGFTRRAARPPFRL